MSVFLYIAKHLFGSHKNKIVVQIYSAKIKLISARAKTEISSEEKEKKRKKRCSTHLGSQTLEIRFKAFETRRENRRNGKERKKVLHSTPLHSNPIHSMVERNRSGGKENLLAGEVKEREIEIESERGREGERERERERERVKWY